MKKPIFAPFMVALFSSAVACALAGNVVLSADTTKASSVTISSLFQITAPSDMTSGSTTLRMVDISHHNNVTDWTALSHAVDGIFIKATEGVSYTDPQFSNYASSAIAAGMSSGYYHYFWPTSDISLATQQAQHFYDTIKDYSYALVPVLDVEETGGQSAAVICADVKAFADEFERLSGQKIMIYCCPNFADTYLSSDMSLSEYQLWIAHYYVETPRVTQVWPSYVVWQYTDKISVAGVSDPVDVDIATEKVFLTGAAPASSVSAQSILVRS